MTTTVPQGPSHPRGGPAPYTGPSRPRLSPRQRRILWHRAQGLSGPQAARAEEIAVGTLAYHEQVILTRLRARNMTQAVHLATIANLIGTYADCGDRAAYLRHLRRRETTCVACRAANATHAVKQRVGALKGVQGPQNLPADAA